MSNPFIRKPSEYVRDLDLLENYIQAMATYISVSTGRAYEEALQWTRRYVRPVDPSLKVLSRRTGGDRIKELQPLSKYLKEIEHTGRMLGPNWVMYENPAKSKSFLSDFVEKALVRRSQVKKKGQAAEMLGDIETAKYYDAQQARLKGLNNSISGAYATPHNPIYNPSAHTTMTSVCRCAVSYSNALVERLLSGNRHYTSPDVALSDMVASIRLADVAVVEKAMSLYNIVPPSADALLEHILESCNLYWRSARGEKQIQRFIGCLNDTQRAIVAFTCDMKAMKDHNSDLLRSFFSALVELPSGPVEDPDQWVSQASGDLQAMVSLVLSDVLMGRTLHDIKANDPAAYGLFGAMVKQATLGLLNYEPLIAAFYRTDHLPANIYEISTSLRKTVIVSDTDSTIFTTEDWVEWYTGTAVFGREAMSVAGAIAYVDSQILAHQLALLSCHLGVKDDKLHKLAMKNEFYQPVMGVTNMSKHYFSYIQACEGNVYSQRKFDTKGVNLKNSRLPKEITNCLNYYIKWIMDCVIRGHRPTLHELLEVPCMIAKDIVSSLELGKPTYLSSMSIKPSDAYTASDRAPARIQNSFWEAVFAPVYGTSPPAPYTTIKVPVLLSKRTQMERWAATMEPDMRERLVGWLTKYAQYHSSMGAVQLHTGDLVLHDVRFGMYCGKQGRVYKYRGPNEILDLSKVDFKQKPDLWEDLGSTRDGFSHFLIPTTALKDGLIPPIIASVIDVSKIEDEMMAGFHIALECCGYYIKNGSRTRRLSMEIDTEVDVVDNAIDEA